VGRRLHDDLRPVDDQPAAVRAGGVPVPALCLRRGRGRRGRGARREGSLSDLELALRAARIAGDLLLERFGGPARGVERKSSRTDLVSDADREAEAAIEEVLLGERPEDGLLAEEGAHSEGASGRRWVVDPLDGTTNYLYGIPAWAVSVALEDDSGALVGVVLDPVRGEAFTAIRGEGAWLGEAQLAIDPSERLDTALVATGFGYDAQRRAEQAQLLAAVLPRVRDIRRAGAAALDLCSVAAGRVDAYYERGLQPWDWAAGRLIAAEAGAVVRELAGEPAGLVAAPPALIDELVALVE
jgi:myo-inositol-1(or 4)-monophosphatase